MMTTSLQDRLRHYAVSSMTQGPRKSHLREDLKAAAARLDRLEFILANLQTVVVKDARIVVVRDVVNEGG